jgi:phosphatidylinositol alpha-1,6-mannosyltransferase
MPLPRILLVLTEFPPRIGGMQTHGVHLVRHLAERGYPGVVLTHRPTRDDEVEHWRHVDAQMPLPVHRVLSRLSHWATLRRIEAFARDWKPDLIYCSTVFYGALHLTLGVPVLCRSVGNDVMRPWIAWPYRPLSRVFSTAWLERHLVDLYERVHSPEWLERLARGRRRQLTEASARQMTTVIANSDFTAGLLRRIGVPPERLDVLVGGVDAARFDPRGRGRAAARQQLGLPAGAWLLTTACRLVPKKGIDFLLQAFAVLRTHMADAHLVIIGSGPKARHWLAAADAAGLAGAVRFVGRVEHDAMPAHFLGGGRLRAGQSGARQPAFGPVRRGDHGPCAVRSQRGGHAGAGLTLGRHSVGHRARRQRAPVRGGRHRRLRAAGAVAARAARPDPGHGRAGPGPGCAAFRLVGDRRATRAPVPAVPAGLTPRKRSLK